MNNYSDAVGDDKFNARFGNDDGWGQVRSFKNTKKDSKKDE